MLMQTTAGYPIEEHRKVRIFRKSVLGHHLIAGILADFDHENLDSAHVRPYHGIREKALAQPASCR
jgi:hypothetical protein